MRNKDFIPRRDQSLLMWGMSFVQRIAIHHADFNITPAEVDECQTAWGRFDVAWSRSTDPGTIGRMATLEKNEARRAFVAIARRLAAKVRSAGASEAQRLAVCLSLPSDDHPQTSKLPAEVPVLFVLLGEGQAVRVWLQPQKKTGRKARPRNTAGALIFACFGDRPLADRRKWCLIATTTMRRATVKFTPEDAVHARVWLRACWITPTLRRGRMSQPVAAYVPQAVPASMILMRQAA